MNGKYLLPTYRLRGYTPVDGYSGVASHGNYGSVSCPTCGAPRNSSDYGFVCGGICIGAIIAGGTTIAGGLRKYEKGKDKKKAEKKRKKAKRKAAKTLAQQKQEATAKYEGLQERAAETQRGLEQNIADAEDERDRKAAHLRSQLQITLFSDTKRGEMEITDADLERLYAKSRDQMLEEFVAVGTSAEQELEAIRLAQEGADVEGINWKMILGSVAVLGGGYYFLSNRKGKKKRKKGKRKKR
jgi:uncharacterized Zn finger protein (UPF0148 family)